MEHLSGKLKRILDSYERMEKSIIEGVSMALFVHCYSLIESRTLYFPTTKDPKSEVGAMIALYDMCNHTE